MEAGTTGDNREHPTGDCTDTASAVCLPPLAEEVTEARLLRCYRAAGERVVEGEPLYECETDKVTVDVDAPFTGELTRWLVAEGDVVAIGTPIALVRADGPARAAPAPSSPAGPAPAEPPGRDTAAGLRAPAERTAPAARDEPADGDDPAAGADTLPRMSPLARRHARLHGIGPEELSRIPRRGSLLTPADIDRHREATAAGPTRADGPGFDDVPLTAPQLRLNQALDRSRAEVTAGTVTVALDAAALRRAAARLRTGTEVGFVSDFQALARLAALTARAHPRLRARRMGRDTLRVFHDVTLGLAVASADADLAVGGLPHAADDDFAAFSRRWVEALDAARTGRSTVDGTATLLVSSLDDDGALHATPVVVPPAVGTLLLGAPSAADGRRLLTLAYDHSVLNGREAARFLDAVRLRVMETGSRRPDRPAGTAPASAPPGPAPSPTGPAGRGSGGEVLARLTALAEQVMDHAPGPDAPLGAEGLTSKGAVHLVALANEAFGCGLTETAVWHHPTLRELAAAVGETARPSPAAGHGTPPAGAAESQADRAAVVVGMACRFPGAEGPDAFWDVLVREECTVTEVPPGRLGPEPGGEAGRVVHRAGLLTEPDAFDAEFFGIPPRQARSMDPQQRMLLELSWHALEDAGLAPDRLAGTRTGVFVGASSYDFRERTVAAGAADGYATLGTFPTFLANRVSYHYDLTGPSITVDTACSASLTALVLAVSAIERGECDTALVGGVNLLGNGFNQAAFQQAGMLSPRGLSRAFDADADGYVRGEGAAWLVLRSRHRALADGDPLLAVVRGACANHGGRAGGPTAPNPRAQTRLIRDALDRAGLSGRDLGYVEAHGTGTPLGDPIELEALRAAVGTGAAAGPGGTLPVGSVKANIGHLEAAAGLAGVIKVLLAMRHGTIPGTPHFTRLNPAVDLSDSALAVAGRTGPWPAGESPRRAAVSSFGIGGSNAHVVLEECDPGSAGPDTDAGPYVLPLSVATPQALPVLAGALLGRLDRAIAEGRPVRLDAWAWTLQTGRAALPVRAVVSATGTGELRAALRAVATAAPHPALDAAGDPEGPAARWAAGQDVDWAAHRPGPGRPPRRVPLPGHPFSRRRFAPPWQGDDVPAGPVPRETLGAPSILVPQWVHAPADGARPVPAAGPGTGPEPTVTLLVHDPETEDLARSWADSAVPAPTLSEYGGGLPELPGGRTPLRVVFVVGGARWSLDAAGGGQLRRWLRTVVRTAAALDARGAAATLTLVTTGMTASGSTAAAGAALQGALLGALRSLPQESPLLSVAAVDIPAPGAAGAPPLAALLAEPCGTRAPLVSLGATDEERHVECLVPASDSSVEGTGGALWPTRSPVLIVFGGTGGVGGAVARDLAARRGARLILVGRSAPDDSVRATVRAVRQAGGQAHYVRGDIREEADVAAVFAHCQERYGRPDAVLHAAGTAHDALLRELTDDALDPLRDTKLAAVGPLHRVRARFPGTALVLFSSFLGTFGSQGGLVYAAANAGLDRIAAALDGPDTPTRAVAWGLWQDTGLARRYTGPVRAAFPGLETFGAEDGCAALERCVGSPHPYTLVLGGRPRALDAFRPEAARGAAGDRGDSGAHAPTPAARGRKDRTEHHTQDGREGPHVPEQPGAATERDRRTERAALEERIRSVVRDVLPGDRPLPVDRPWRELGVDSLLHVELTAALSRVFGPLPGTTLHEYGTIDALADRLAPGPPRNGPDERAAARDASPATAPSAVPSAAPPAVLPPRGPRGVPAGPRRAAAQRPVAVIGLAGRYPGAPDVDGLWRLLSEGGTAVREVPADRWDWRTAHVLDATTTRWGCFLDDWDRFDAELFRVPPRDAAVLDAQERQFLETAWEAFESAGYSRARLSRQVSADRVGVYVGVTSHSGLLAQRDARLLGADNAEYGITAYSSVANRVSYAFDLNGPSLAVDTMCSSSLTAVHLACQALAVEDADMALAGGVHLFVHPDRFAALSSVGMTSRGPLNRAFGAGGDGFVPGEGAGAVILKPLDRALADGDTVYAVITGSAVNHGGQGGGYTVPSPVAQADLIGAALDRAGLHPHDIGYVEAHGTGTELGDPIEVRALTRAFEGDPQVRPGSVRIGSVKSNIGHGEAVAGVAGLTKAILQLRHRRLAPSLHARPENPRLELAGGPLRVQHTAEWWPAGGDAPEVRRAAVSSFGAGGSNAHVVVEEFTGQRSPDAGEPGPLVVPLGAPDHERLARVAERLAALIEAPGGTLTGPVSLADVAATLREGRDEWPCRAAVVCAGPDDLGTALAALRALAAGERHAALVVADGAGPPPEPEARAPEAGGRNTPDGAALRLAHAWVTSGAGAWHTVEPTPYRKVALPTTPFAGRRHRVAGPPPEVVEAALLPLRTGRVLPVVTAAPADGPVRAGLPDGHPWVTDHVVDGAPLVPAALAVETVCESLLARGTNPYAVALEDLTFLSPWRGTALDADVVFEDEPDPDGPAPGPRARFPFVIRSAGTAVVRGAVARGTPDGADPRGPFGGLLAYVPERLDAALAGTGSFGHAGSRDVFYRVLAAHGFAYGPGYRSVGAVVRSGDEVLARIDDDGPAGPAGRPVLHPAVLDGAFQAAGYAAAAPDGQPPRERLRPLSVDRFTVHRPAVGPVYVHVRPARGGGPRGSYLFDLRLVDTSGASVAEAEGFLLRAEPLESVPATTPRRVLVPAPNAPAESPGPAGPGDRTAAYTLEWTATGEPPAVSDRSLLVVGGRGGPLGGALTALADATLPWAAFPPGDPEAARAALDDALAGLDDDADLVLLLDEEDLEPGIGRPSDSPAGATHAYEQFATAVTLPVFAALRALVAGRRPPGAQVRLVVCAGPDAASAAQHALHGLVRTASGETGRFGIGLVSVDRRWCVRAPGDAAASVRTELARTAPAPWVRLAPDGTRLTAGLVRRPRAKRPFGLRPDGCYLVVGGTGGLGRAVTASILRHAPQARVVVAGRRAAPAPGSPVPSGAPGPAPDDRTVEVRCDLTDPGSVSALAAELDSRGLRLNGVVCLAGVVRDGFLRTKTAEAVDEVCRVKVLGATALDAALAHHPLDFYVLASSVAVHVGNQGQADYAFANGFLDGFARARARWVAAGIRPGRTLAVGWPALTGGGMRPPASTLDFLRETYGLEALPVTEAAEELWWLLAASGGTAAHAVLAHGDLARWAEATGARGSGPAPAFRAVSGPAAPEPQGTTAAGTTRAGAGPAGATRDTTAPAGTAPARATPAATTPPGAAPADAGDVRAGAVRWLTEQVHAVTGLPVESLAPEAGLTALGVDSIALTRLARALENSLGRLPRSTLFDHDSISELAEGLLTVHGEALTRIVAPARPGSGEATVSETRGTPAHAAAHGTVEQEPAAQEPAAHEPAGQEPAGQAGREEPEHWPMTERQVPLWTAEHAARPHAPYNLSLAWRLPAGHDRDATATALASLLARHPVLTRRIGPEDGSLRFLPAAPPPSGVWSLRETCAERLFDALLDEADRRLPLETGPAVRAVLWDDGSERDVLQLTVHHLLADGRSVELLAEDLGALLGQPAPPGAEAGDAAVPSGSIASFGRFLAQEAAADTVRRAESSRAWRERLRAVPAAPRFPGGTPTAGPWEAGHREYRMPAALRDRLRAAATEAGVSDFTVHLAAYALAVATVTGRDSFLVSVPTYGRPGPEYDRTVGHFVNSVVVRLRPAPESSLRHWLTELHGEVRSALALAELPYPATAELCRTADGGPAVPTLTFAYQNWPRPSGPGGGPLAERIFIRGQGGHWDLGLELTDTADGVEILANHRRTALTPTELDAFVDTWFVLAAVLADDLGAPAGELLRPGALTLPGRFRTLVRRHRDEVAVRDTSGDGLTYAEVDRRTAALVRALRAAGARPGEPVAVLMGRSTRLPVALLGVLRAGCPYVPLDASYPAERLRMVLEEAGCAVAVTERSEAGHLAGSGLRTVLFDELADAPPGVREEPEEWDGPADAPAYLMFTSGSTGRPKGVAVSHRSVLHTLDAFRTLLGWGPRGRLLAVTTASFDISVLELLLPLVSGGGRVVVADADTVRDGSRLDRVVDAEGITVMQATPSGWQLLLDSGWTGRPGLTALCGGEPLPAPLARVLAARVGCLWNVYGPTEATIWSTAAELSAGGPVVLGDPVGATGLVVTVPGPDGRPAAAADGETGELWIGGPAVADGYWGRPEQTAQRFTGHPLRPGHGGRWFRTGDLVRRSSDGGLRFVGRTDTQVKIRGHRLELGEVETVLGEHPGAGQAAVLVRGTGAAARLVAVVVPRAGCADPAPADLAAFVARRLPAWMRPQEYVVRAGLPRTPNGKTDRAALAGELAADPTGEPTGEPTGREPVPGGAGTGVDREHIGRQIVWEWRRLLGTDEVERDSTFFSAGGNSVLLGTLFARLSARFPAARLEMGDLFSHPTPARQEALVAERLASEHTADRQPAAVPEETPDAGPGTGPAAGAPPDSPDRRFPAPELTPQALRRARRRSFRSAVTEAG